MAIEPIEPRVTTFSGEGITRSLRQGGAAVAGVAAHEALNIVVLRGQAVRAGADVVDEEVEVRFGLNPETGRVEVVGGRSRVTFRSRSPRSRLDGPNEADGSAAPDEPAQDRDPIAKAAKAGPGAEDQATQQAIRLVDQASAAVDRRLVEAEGERQAAADPDESQRADQAIRALKQKRADLEAARRLLELERANRQMAAMLDQAVNGPTEVAFRLGAAARLPVGRGDDRGSARPQPQRPTGVFIPAMTLSGLLVNTRV